MTNKSIILVAILLISGGTISLQAEETVKNSQGAEIILHDNFTWSFKDAEGGAATEAMVLDLIKSPDQKKIFKSPSGKYSIYFDPSIWHQTKELNASAETNFINISNDGYAMALFDGLYISLEKMKNIVIVNAQNIDKNAALINSQACTVNGTPGLIVTYTAENQGLKFIFYSLIVAAEKGTLQFSFFTLDNAFEKLKPAFIKAMSGLVF